MVKGAATVAGATLIGPAFKLAGALIPAMVFLDENNQTVTDGASAEERVEGGLLYAYAAALVAKDALGIGKAEPQPAQLSTDVVAYSPKEAPPPAVVAPRPLPARVARLAALPAMMVICALTFNPRVLASSPLLLRRTVSVAVLPVALLKLGLAKLAVASSGFALRVLGVAMRMKAYP